MSKEYESMVEVFPNPERLDKVDESMRNLLEVVKERDIAYNMLETGETGEPKVRWVRNALGIKYPRTEEEHAVPKEENKEYRLLHSEWEPWMKEYHDQFEEKLRLNHEKRARADRYIRRRLKKEFPHLTNEELDLGVKQHKERNEHNDL
uniref:Putative 39S ribosomal protein L47, mitochondrial-like protein n=1 Tax=Pinctada fucata TaxID=50426 RepID=A0A194AM23_PINFU